jgi:hypothetical protein
MVFILIDNIATEPPDKANLLEGWKREISQHFGAQSLRRAIFSSQSRNAIVPDNAKAMRNA